MNDSPYSERTRELVDAMDDAGFYIDTLSEPPQVIEIKTGRTQRVADSLVTAWLADGKGSVSTIVAECVKAFASGQRSGE